MAIPTANTECRSLQTLPAELLLEITKHISDFPSLNGLLTLLAAHSRGVAFVEDCQTEIFANVIRAGRAQELSRVVTAVMTLRSDSTTKRILLMKGARENFVYKYLRSDDRERDGKPHYLQCFSDPIAAIRDVWSVSRDIEALVQDFARTRVVKPSEQPERPVSSAELYRIRRALWQFQLLYELCHSERSLSSGDDDKAQELRPRRLVYHQTHPNGESCFPSTGWLYGHSGKAPPFCCAISACGWEIKEVNAVRFHLASLVNTFQYHRHETPSRLKSQPDLLKRLIDDLDHWREDQESPVDHLLVAKLGSEQDRPPVADAEQWGWGMWDAERLSKRGLDPGSEHTRSRRLSDKAFRECERAQSTDADRWVSDRFRDDVRPAEVDKRQRQEQAKRQEQERRAEEKRQQEEKAKRRQQKRREQEVFNSHHRVLDKSDTTPQKPLSRNARRKANKLARKAEKENTKRADQCA
ncbi:MAG: hypothetical protein ASARMPREDX12_003902 [Alectoria sarmentosa]|nr:MAG: hypothetical protein ASARMPREDX12_003902 [Alectoria sarmentosa]